MFEADYTPNCNYVVIEKRKMKKGKKELISFFVVADSVYRRLTTRRFFVSSNAIQTSLQCLMNSFFLFYVTTFFQLGIYRRKAINVETLEEPK